VLSLSFGGDAEGPWLAGHEALLAHSLPHQLQGTLGLFTREIDVDAPVCVSDIGLLEKEVDPIGQVLAAGRGGRLLTRRPVLETRG